ncbi:MAG: preprotein translocase subunit SecA [Proteobacteria bacterium]|nr:preprotein translocase subunit SecA [Pseudomonadota bacterium]
MGLFQKIFGSRNQRELKKMGPVVDAIAALEPKIKAKSDAELKAMTGELKTKLDNGATLDDILPEAFATVREASVRATGMRHYDVQMIGGMVLHSGKIAEMRTGEGKTLVATLPTYLNALGGKGVHVVTVNAYLAKRDAEWMGRIHGFLGLTTGVIVHGLDDNERQRNYNCDITYGQNNEFGFDYLRDNMKQNPDRMVQRLLNYAVVDEVDSILIDEARTPLIISGAGEASGDLYVKIDRLIPRLKREEHYTVDEKSHQVMMTDDGVEKMEQLLSVDNLYEATNIALVHHVNQARRAHMLSMRNVNYLVDQGKVVIISEDTGRAMPGRRWSDGLHQAIEAKEGVTVEEENQTLATVTFQNYFRLYKKLCGMTGTADTEAQELHQIYKLDVMVIPTNKPMVRKDHADLVYKNEQGKFRAVVADIEDCYKRGQPVLVGTVSVEKSEVVANLLKQKNLPFNVLNAKQHQREASIVAQAGRKGAITIATNMAGRGTDILLGGNAEAMAKDELAEEKAKLAPLPEESQPAVDEEGMAIDAPFRGASVPSFDEEARLAELVKQHKADCDAERLVVLEAGGLKIIGTERHESRRIDNQLRGRAGRQGDPGSSRFYLSLQDDLLRIFGLDKMAGLMERLGLEEDVPIESPMVTRSIEGAQKKVEGRNFDQRKNVLEYDDVMNQQRKTIYAMRRQILEGRYHREPNEEELKAGIEPEPVTESGDWTLESVTPDIEPKLTEMVDLPKLNEIARHARAGFPMVADDKKKAAATAINAVETIKPPYNGSEPWEQVLSRMDGTPPKRLGLILEHYYDVKLDDLLAKPTKELDAWLAKQWPDVPPNPDTRPPWRVLRGEIWRQFGTLLDLEKTYDKPRKELLELCIKQVAGSLIQQRERLHDTSDARMAAVIEKVMSPDVTEDEWDWDELEDALEEQFNIQIDVAQGTPDEVAAQVWPEVEKKLAEREKELERPWLMYFQRHFSLEEIDAQWIEHLKTMESLREGIGLQGYGQKDPKKEYKKAGFTMFSEMMDRIGANTISKLFRVQMERQPENVPQLKDKQRELEEHGGAAGKSDEEEATQQQAQRGGQQQARRAPGEPQGNDGDETKEPTRRERPKVGRNDPCPCNSGKKYKKCHGKDDEAAASE